VLESADVRSGDWLHIFGVVLLVLNRVVESLLEFDWLTKSLEEVSQDGLPFHLELVFFLLLSLGCNLQVKEMLD